jgi:peptide/nickel transport system substrate-binding protein
MQPKRTNRREFLKMTAVAAAGAAVLAACTQPPAPASTSAPQPQAPAPTTAPAAPAATTAPAPTTAAAPAATAKPAAAPAATAAPAAATGQLKQVPRNRTLIMAGLGGEHPGGFTDVDNYNIWVPNFSRSGYSNVASQPLFYYNMMKDEFIPWNAVSAEYNSDFTEVTVKLRNGVTWSDGEPFDANDIAFTINTHLATPELSLAIAHAPVWLYAGVKVIVPDADPAIAVPPVISTASAVPVPPEI